MNYVLVLLVIAFIVYRSQSKPARMPSKEIVQKVKNLIASNHIFVASKTYCPYCQATLRTFDQLGVQPNVLQLNQIDEGAEIQDALREITGQTTVPNIFIDGKHIGGNSELQALKSKGVLNKLLKL